MSRFSGDDLHDAHHPFVLVVDSVTVIDETPHDRRIGKRDDHLQYAWPIIRRWRHREGVSQTVLILTDPRDLRHQEPGLMDMKAVVLLIGVDDGPLLGVTEFHGLVDAVLVHDAPIDHENLPVGCPRILQYPAASDRGGPHLIDPPRALNTLTQNLGFGARACSP